MASKRKSKCPCRRPARQAPVGLRKIQKRIRKEVQAEVAARGEIQRKEILEMQQQLAAMERAQAILPAAPPIVQPLPPPPVVVQEQVVPAQEARKQSDGGGVMVFEFPRMELLRFKGKTDEALQPKEFSYPKCTYCGKYHEGECRLKLGVCLRCGQQGHFIKDCPQDRPQFIQPRESQPIVQMNQPVSRSDGESSRRLAKSTGCKKGYETLQQRKKTFPKCFHCGKYHDGKCRFRTKACLKCGLQGHFIRDCPNNKPPHIQIQGSQPSMQMNRPEGRGTGPSASVFQLSVERGQDKIFTIDQGEIEQEVPTDVETGKDNL